MSEYREAPIVDFSVECHLAMDRLKEAARLEKEAAWTACREHCAAVDKATTEAIASIRSVAGLPSLVRIEHEGPVSNGIAAAVLGRLGFRQRVAKIAPESGERKAA